MSSSEVEDSELSQDHELPLDSSGLEEGSEEEAPEEFDSDSDQQNLYDDSDDEVERRIEEEKEQLRANEVWGSKKGSFYGRDKQADDVSSEDDMDELGEAVRLQAIRARKLGRMREKEGEVEDGSEAEEV